MPLQRTRKTVQARKDPIEKVTEQSTLMQAPTTEEAKVKAVEVLETLHARGELKPVSGWNPQRGSVLDAYKDILGLNDRSIALNDRAFK